MGTSDGWFELPEMSPEEAEQFVQDQRELCRRLFMQEVTDASQLAEDLHEVVGLHLLACHENHYPVRGISLLP